MINKYGYMAIGFLAIILAVSYVEARRDIEIAYLYNNDYKAPGEGVFTDYIRGRCHRNSYESIKCDIERIRIEKISKERIESMINALKNARKNPEELERFFRYHMPTELCNDKEKIKEYKNDHAQYDKMSKEEIDLKNSILKLCYDKNDTEDAEIENIIDTYKNLQYKTCIISMSRYEQAYELYHNQWINKTGPIGKCGDMTISTFKDVLNNDQGQAKSFNSLKIREIMLNRNQDNCKESEENEREYVAALRMEKPRYANCVYVEIGSMGWGWNFYELGWSSK